MPSQAKVKAVNSGDTVVLVSLNKPTEEKILSLAYVSAPRMRREGDEVGLNFQTAYNPSQ
jgi:staphylococcal nuclease domain-containing protein 1